MMCLIPLPALLQPPNTQYHLCDNAITLMDPVSTAGLRAITVRGLVLPKEIDIFNFGK